MRTTLLFAVVMGAVVSAAAWPTASSPQQRRSAPPPARRQAQNTAAVSLDAFLEGAPALRRQIVWETADGRRQPFDQWTPQMRERIDACYRRFAAERPDRSLRAFEAKSSGGSVYFTADQAFAIYAANLAHVLYVEANHLVPWSIQSHPPAELEALLSSNSYFARIRPAENRTYPPGIAANHDFQEAAPDWSLGELTGDPLITYDFVTGRTSATHQSMVGSTELQTLVNLTEWLRTNGWHGPMHEERITASNGQRWLEDRLAGMVPEKTPPEKMFIALDGCHSASKLMVDLARSINIPLLHARALDGEKADAKTHFFSRTHGGLVYGWAGRMPRICWHTDEIYAMPGHLCVPVDARTGGPASKEDAAQQFFDEIWATPEQLKKAGFVYHLARVLPDQGEGHDSRGKSEDRYDFGMMSGRWNKKGTSLIENFFQLAHDSTLCSVPYMQLYARRPGGIVLKSSLTQDFRKWKGEFTDDELPQLLPMQTYLDRAAACVAAIGGADKLEGLAAQLSANRGKNLLVQR